jgi:tetratricopeptide (TPR) repeat protein
MTRRSRKRSELCSSTKFRQKLICSWDPSWFSRCQYDQAIDQLRSGIELEPNYWFAHYFLGRAYEQKGRLPEAISEFQRAVELEKDNAENWANLGHAYAQSGKRAEAQKILDHLKELSAHTYVAPYNIAVCRLGRKGAGIRLA